MVAKVGGMGWAGGACDVGDINMLAMMGWCGCNPLRQAGCEHS